MRIITLLAPLALIFASLGCQEAVLDPHKTAAAVGQWKDECGLLWVITLEPDLDINVQVTGRTGEMIRYGGGMVVGKKHLISPFCRTDLPTVHTFHCQISSPSSKPFSGRVEAWYLGAFLDGWDIRDTHQFKAQVVLPTR
jgi:hypothetical protein